jgi:citrate synthase
VSADKVSIEFDGKKDDYAVLPATQGPGGIDISKLMANTGLSTFDQGFVNTSSTKSSITYIDGDEGILRYRGYPIEELASQKSFLETTYLLIYGELPSADEAAEFDQSLRRHTLLHEDMKDFFRAFPHNAHPMSVMSSAVTALSTFYQDSLDPKDPEQVEISTLRLLAKLPVIAAYAHKNSVGQAFVYPDNSLSMVENFLKMTFGNYAEEYTQNSVVTKALDTLLLLHADHEQNCSTSTVRLVGSSQANLFASVSAGVNALSGPLHGGANEAVLEMLRFIQNSGETVTQYVERVKNKEDGIRLMSTSHSILERPS